MGESLAYHLLAQPRHFDGTRPLQLEMKLVLLELPSLATTSSLLQVAHQVSTFSFRLIAPMLPSMFAARTAVSGSQILSL